MTTDRRGDVDAIWGPLDGGEIPGGCHQCNAYQVITKEGHGLWRITVHHDWWCRRWAAIQARQRRAS